jgi:hypothetical protein
MTLGPLRHDILAYLCHVTCWYTFTDEDFGGEPFIEQAPDCLHPLAFLVTVRI